MKQHWLCAHSVTLNMVAFNMLKFLPTQDKSCSGDCFFVASPSSIPQSNFFEESFMFAASSPHFVPPPAPNCPAANATALGSSPQTFHETSSFSIRDTSCPHHPRPPAATSFTNTSALGLQCDRVLPLPSHLSFSGFFTTSSFSTQALKVGFHRSVATDPCLFPLYPLALASVTMTYWFSNSEPQIIPLFWESHTINRLIWQLPLDVLQALSTCTHWTHDLHPQLLFSSLALSSCLRKTEPLSIKCII